VSASTAVSYCTVCDALPGECEHKAARYLDPIVYERVPGVGWAVPASEKADWLRREARLFQDGHDREPGQKREPRAEERVKPLQQVVVELEAWIDLDPALEATFRAYFEREPQKATRLAAEVIEGARSGRLRKPAGLLYSRLPRGSRVPNARPP